MMLSGNMFENRVISDGTAESVIERRDDRAGLYSQFLRLIECDEGVPFQFIFGQAEGEGYYGFMGKGIKRLLGIESEVITEKEFGNMIEEIIPLTENLPADINTLRKELVNHRISDYRLEMKVSALTGEKKWIRETSMPLKDQSGKVIGIMGILHDSSERRRVLAYLAEASEKADESDRLKNAFLQNISHEVRTPLNAIVGFSALLCEPEEGYHKNREFVNLINNSTDHFLEIMDNILEISRIDAGSVTTIQSEVRPGNVMKRIMRNYAAKAEEKQLRLECIIPCDNSDLTLYSDGYKLTQVMNNLVGNAIKFTFSGIVEFGYNCRQDDVEFFVSDTGIGIQDEHKSRIFDKFYQVESGATRRFQGTGLGLSISKAYVDMLGGKISFSSKVGEGSTFRFFVPLG
jgi:signal transduction histidine kinase